MKRIATGLLAAAMLGLAAWQGALALQNEQTAAPATTPPAEENAAAPAVAEQQPSEPARPAAASPAARMVTPMPERVAVLGVLNKRNGLSRDIALHPGQAVRIGDLIVRLRACETTAPWEPEKLTGAFVQADVRERDNEWRRVFSGWLYKESPSLNVVEHRIYDVWPKSCAMRYPEIGPETVPASSPGAAPRRSSAKKSGEGADAPVETPSASSSNVT